MRDSQDNIRAWLAEQLRSHGRGSKGKLAEHLGVRPDAITRMLNNEPGKETRDIKAHELSAMRVFFGSDYHPESRRPLDVNHIPVLGSARAGAFLDISILDQSDEPDTIPVVPDTRYARARQYALKIDGDSMDRVFRDGEFAICASWPETGYMHPEDGQCLHVERMRGELVEVTIKRFRIRDGRKWLDPESSNPAHKPIEINGDEATEICVKGLVIGVWRAI